MDIERRRRIEELCDAALDREVAERSSFVATACADDDGLRREVEALLAHAGAAESFLDTPIGGLAALVLADEDRTIQVLTNLTGNALQYTPEGGNITISAKRSNNEIQISIHDTGIGIPPEHLTNIFDRFYRVDKSRSRQAGGGSGIGLTVARALVEAHGGRIWAESNGIGQGSTFTFSLKIAE
jgi:signal transduction histidine kinase